MYLHHAISPNSIVLRLKSTKKKDVIGELLDQLVAADRIPNRRGALKALMEREKKMSTGMHNGIALPHGKTDSVESVVAALGLAPEGVDFDAMDGQPSQFFVLTVSPINRDAVHIQWLGAVSELLGEERHREALLACSTSEAVYELLGRVDEESQLLEDDD